MSENKSLDQIMEEAGHLTGGKTIDRERYSELFRVIEDAVIKLKPSQKCKQAGLKNLLQLCEISGKSRATLIRWSKKDPDFFELVLSGAVLKLNKEKANNLDIVLPGFKLPAILIKQNG